MRKRVTVVAIKLTVVSSQYHSDKQTDIKGRCTLTEQEDLLANGKCKYVHNIEGPNK